MVHSLVLLSKKWDPIGGAFTSICHVCYVIDLRYDLDLVIWIAWMDPDSDWLDILRFTFYCWYQWYSRPLS